MGQRRVASGSQTALREANREHIIENVKRFGHPTQVELVEATGLSSATVSIIVNELSQAGVLELTPTSRSGRRALQVTLARQLGLVAGVYVGRRQLRIGLADLSGKVVAEQHMPLPADHRADTVLDRIALFVNEMISGLDGSHDELLGLGIGVAAPIDRSTGMIATRNILRGWDSVPIKQALEGRVGVAVTIDNDCNLGCLAEARHGAASGTDVVAYVRIGHAVGAGIAIEGNVLRGHHGIAAELGHIKVVDDGLICTCGNRGCLETMVNANVMIDSLRASHGILSLPEIISRALEGDIGCTRVLSDTGRHVGTALAAMCNVVDPAVVVVGGEVVEAGEIVLEPLRQATSRHALPSVNGPTPVIAGALGVHAEFLGAIYLALDAVSVTTSMPIG